MTLAPVTLRHSLLCAVVSVLLVGGVAVGRPSQVLAGPAELLARALPSPGKPAGPLEIDLQPNGSGRAALVMVPRAPVTSVDVLVSATGAATAAGSTTRSVTSGGSVTVPVTYATTGDGTVVAAVTGRDASGRPVVRRTDVLFVRDSFGTPLASTQGTLDLELRHLARARQRGVLDDAAYEAAVEDARSGGAQQTITPSSAPPRPRVGGTITISGIVRWTDVDGGLHPVRGASVQVRDQETSGSVLVRAVKTNNSGRYSATFVNDDGPGEGGRDIFVVVFANGTGFRVQPVGGPTHRMQTGVANNVDDVDLTANLTAGTFFDSHTAFSVQDSLITITRHTTALHGAGLPTVPVIFPTNEPTSQFDGSALHILQLDRFDHDVIDHEYGHYVTSELGIDNSPGGRHSLSENLAERLGKSAGLRLAWGEGWPTYFAVTGQRAQGAAGAGIPNVGDLNYTDTEDSTLDYSLETGAGGASLGEDNELSVQRILLDLDDTRADTGDNRGVALGNQTVWNRIDNSNSVTLGAAYNALIAGRSAKQVADFGCIFGTHKVAPQITAPADQTQTSSTPPTITWARNGLGPSFRNNRFTVRFYTATFDTVLFTSAELTGTSFKPTQSQWNSILGNPSRTTNVVVRGGNASAPVTGPYTSCNIRLVEPK